MKYSDLELKTNIDTDAIKIGDKIVRIVQYLPLRDKIDLIQIALQKSQENGIYNEMKLQMYFNLYLVYMYTDLEFTEEEKANEEELYDELESNDLFTDIIAAIDEKEYDFLINHLEVMKQRSLKYKTSAAALLQSFIQDLPKNAQAAADIVDHFDKDKYKEVVEFAQYANGGRPV